MENTDLDVTVILNKLALLITEAVKRRDRKALDVLFSLGNGIIEVQNLYDVFGNCPNVDGKNGVARQLKISRNAVYLRLKLLGLAAKDFRPRNTTVQSLIWKSKRLSRIMKEVERLSKEWNMPW